MDILYLIRAKAEHKDLLYKWINDEAVRKNSLHDYYVEYAEHCKWFEEKLQNPNTLMLVCKKNEEYIGQVRVDFNLEGEGKISFSIDRRYRGQGFGTKILGLLETYLREVFFYEHEVIRLVAIVKSSNLASQKCFEKLGYVKECLKENILFSKTFFVIGIICNHRD